MRHGQFAVVRQALTLLSSSSNCEPASPSGAAVRRLAGNLRQPGRLAARWNALEKLRPVDGQHAGLGAILGEQMFQDAGALAAGSIEPTPAADNRRPSASPSRAAMPTSAQEPQLTLRAGRFSQRR